MMQPRLRPTGSRAKRGATAERRSLAVVHAAALYRPTPPVECDEDGYPFSDAKPMSEGDYHGDVLSYAKGALRARFDGHQVYASTDKFLFLEEGDRRAAVVPDVLVAFGPPSGPRQSYKHWEEGKAPDFVLEVLSADNWRNDIERKPVLYAELGVQEYWTFDRVASAPMAVQRWRAGVLAAAEPGRRSRRRRPASSGATSSASTSSPRGGCSGSAIRRRARFSRTTWNRKPYDDRKLPCALRPSHAPMPPSHAPMPPRSDWPKRRRLAKPPNVESRNSNGDSCPGLARLPPRPTSRRGRACPVPSRSKRLGECETGDLVMSAISLGELEAGPNQPAKATATSSGLSVSILTWSSRQCRHRVEPRRPARGHDAGRESRAHRTA